jgi:DNA replication protein DnaC
MLNETTITKLHEMKLSVMAKALRDQMEDSDFNNIPFEERLGLIVDAEWNARKNNRLKRLIRSAGYEFPNACVEDIEYRADRKLDKAQITRLATCNYIQETYNIILLGARLNEVQYGNGKTYISNAFGVAANRNFYSVRRVCLHELLGELAIARAEGKYQKTVRPYKQTNLLIFDEWLLFPVTELESRDILDIVNYRHKRASTIFCSQFPTNAWYEKIPEPAVADAICDRIIHDSYTIFVDGSGMRKQKGVKTKD